MSLFTLWSTVTSQQLQCYHVWMQNHQFISHFYQLWSHKVPDNSFDLQPSKPTAKFKFFTQHFHYHYYSLSCVLPSKSATKRLNTMKFDLTLLSNQGVALVKSHEGVSQTAHGTISFSMPKILKTEFAHTFSKRLAWHLTERDRK